MSVKAYRTSLFAHRLRNIAEEMGRRLALSAFSPNIRERLDFSCAVFGPEAELLAQAAHIPVHLGSLPDLVATVHQRRQRPGDCWIANSPYQGGTHLPDLTLVAPVFAGSELIGYVASRAHHADVGGMTPGSMPNSREVHQEGLILPPLRILRGGRRHRDLWQLLLANVRNPAEREGDLRAQLASCRLGVKRCLEVYQAESWREQVNELLRAGQEQMEQLLKSWGEHREVVEIELDWGEQRLPLHLQLDIVEGKARLDFSRSIDGQPLPINATRAITCAAAYFPFFCLARERDSQALINAGSLRCLEVVTRPGSLLEAAYPDPVCAGNVETSQRVCDLVWEALARFLEVPAQSASTMNNLSLGSSRSRPFSYYETCGGGHGAGPQGPGCSGQQVAMTNTRNTPAEILETYYPLRLWRYALRSDSAGGGLHAGGQGVVREIEVLCDAELSLLASRRSLPAQGRVGGGPGAAGQDELLPGGPFIPPWSGQVSAGTRLRLCTPGGGGWGTIS